MVIDSRVGWTGGSGIDDKWFGDGRTNGSWARDECAFRIFLDDLRHADEIVLAAFRQRPWFERLMERGANVLTRLL